MSEARYKEALGNLDSDTRTCFKHLESQINESKASPLKAFQEREKKVLKALSRMEQRDKIWAKGMKTIGKLEEEYREQTPNFQEQMYRERCQKLDNIGKQYVKLFEKNYRLTVRERELAIDIYKDIQKMFDRINKKGKLKAGE